MFAANAASPDFTDSLRHRFTVSPLLAIKGRASILPSRNLCSLDKNFVPYPSPSNARKPIFGGKEVFAPNGRNFSYKFILVGWEFV